MRAICFRPAISTRCGRFPKSCAIGISALKIEGRYKDAEYVALTTRAYRQAVDEAACAGMAPLVNCRTEEPQLEQVYSRGLGPYFLTGTNHQTVVKGRSPRHRGVLMGRVTRVTAEAVIVEPSRPKARSAQARRWRGVRRRGLAQPAKSPKKAAACFR